MRHFGPANDRLGSKRWALCQLCADIAQLVLCRRLHRQVGGLLAFENAIYVGGRAAEIVDDVVPIGNQATDVDEVASVVDRGQIVRAALQNAGWIVTSSTSSPPT